jgi:hypothetical protein
MGARWNFCAAQVGFALKYLWPTRVVVYDLNLRRHLNASRFARQLVGRAYDFDEFLDIHQRQVKVGTQLTSKAGTPAPGTNAKNTSQKDSIGKSSTLVKASQPSSFWTEKLGVDDDDTVEDLQYLYDAKKGILYPAKMISLARTAIRNPAAFSWRFTLRATRRTSPSVPAAIS